MKFKYIFIFILIVLIFSLMMIFQQKPNLSIFHNIFPIERCIQYPNIENIKKYNPTIETKKYCATCGDGICDFIEKCHPSNPITTDCGGGLYCQKDCEKQVN